MTTLTSAFPRSSASAQEPLSAAAWQDYQAATQLSVPSTYAALDQELPNGGWPPSVLIELLLAQAGIGELRLLAPALSRIARAGKTIILLAPPHISLAATLADLDIDASQLLVIEADKPMEHIGKVEQALKNVNVGALLCWLPQARNDHLQRLQSAAADSEGLTFLLRPLSTQNQASPAPLRMICQPATAGCMSVELIKRRGPVHGTPLILQLSLPALSGKAFARRSLAAPAFNSPDYRIDRTALAATAARHRAAIQIRI